MSESENDNIAYINKYNDEHYADADKRLKKFLDDWYDGTIMQKIATTVAESSTADTGKCPNCGHCHTCCSD
tara:strand:- start:1438 stop:1650 length:213 start_codon:yes stop_codon:yes gene_type:complete